MRKLYPLCVLLFITTYLSAQNEWDNVPVPANPGTGMEWQLEPGMSDNFNYSGKTTEFHDKWYDNNPAGWVGPGRTKFANDHVNIVDSKLEISASRIPENLQTETHTESNYTFTRSIYTGFATTKQRMSYPVYFEANMKVSKLVLASNFWAKLGSIDNRSEIDVTETYGGGRTSFQRTTMKTNYHIFRGGNHSKQGNTVIPGGAEVADAYHRFGCYWQDATTLSFYLDGVLVRTITQDDMVDPTGAFLNEEIRIIFDTEDHAWLSKDGITPTDAELADNTKNKMLVDWVRVYKPKVKSAPNTSTETPIGQVISLRKSNGDKKYVTAASNGTILSATGSSVGIAQQFEIIAHPGGGIAIKSLLNNKYVQVVGNDATKAVRNFGSATNGWEHFEWKSKGPGKVAIKSNWSNKWLRAAWNADDTPIYPNATQDYGWETFDWDIVAGAGAKTISEISSKLTAYPNPVQNELNITGLADGETIYLMDITGRKIDIKVTKNNNINTINVTSLNRGTYMIITTLGNIVKFMKQ